MRGLKSVAIAAERFVTVIRTAMRPPFDPLRHVSGRLPGQRGEVLVGREDGYLTTTVTDTTTVQTVNGTPSRALVAGMHGIGVSTPIAAAVPSRPAVIPYGGLATTRNGRLGSRRLAASACTTVTSGNR